MGADVVDRHFPQPHCEGVGVGGGEVAIEVGHAVLRGPDPHVAIGDGEFVAVGDAVGVVAGDEPSSAGAQFRRRQGASVEDRGFELLQLAVADAGEHRGDDPCLIEVDSPGRECDSGAVQSVAQFESEVDPGGHHRFIDSECDRHLH